jgi:hypothetical protein
MLSAMAAPANENTLKKSCTAGSGKLMNDPNLDSTHRGCPAFAAFT